MHPEVYYFLLEWVSSYFCYETQPLLLQNQLSIHKNK
ncbi:unnamed protein product [Acanthoscelides obtectus]|uniref:Uncharacterized protein n=1 Tax=Acanthoscelides obtectus TaxID=200917 RepID=A0A9P0L1G9_ACAOB|nr:unnamed protein product [Acanthoscelides obtectus]CAK1649266.1 hypothetical protein AOBTE_LOCUS16122 [Acanthoscelides obtectus]